MGRSPSRGDPFCWITTTAGAVVWKTRLYVRDGRPVRATHERNDGYRYMTFWDRVEDGVFTDTERYDAHLEDGRYVPNEGQHFTYVRGWLYRYETWDTTYTYAADGLLLRSERSGFRDDRWFYLDGHPTERSLWVQDYGPERRWTWTWDADRLLAEQDSGIETHWVQHDGDLPLRGEVSWYDFMGDPGAATELWTWEHGHPTSHVRVDADGNEELLATWTWDGDRALTTVTPRSSEQWTWDREGRAVSWEQLDADGEAKARRTWTWDGDRLVTFGSERDLVLQTTTWGRTCPRAAWADVAPRPGADIATPGRPVQEPPPSEW